jgi:hypothetical protein
LFNTNQVQPEPKLVAAEVLNFSLKFAKSQKASFIFSAISQLASPQALGAKQFQ